MESPLPNIKFEDIAFTHYTSASRFCSQPDVKHFPEQPQTIALVKPGLQPAIQHNFVDDGNFGQSQMLINYSYDLVERGLLKFNISEILKVDGCNTDPTRPDGAWIRGSRSFSFRFKLPKDNHFYKIDILPSVSPSNTVRGQVLRESFQAQLARVDYPLPPTPVALPYTFMEIGGKEFICTIFTSDLAAQTTTPGPQDFRIDTILPILIQYA